MGILLDSSVFIAGERAGTTVRSLAEALAQRYPNQEFALSVVTLSELAHGVSRADSEARRALRQRYLDEVCFLLPAHPVSSSIALRAGLLNGACQMQGKRIAFADLLIGVTALEMGYAVGTSNVRHLRMIPDLKVLEI